MRCIVCDAFSWPLICQACQRTLLAPNIHRRIIKGLEVISFYPYADIEKLLHTKHTPIGAEIYRILARYSFTPFARAFKLSQPIAAIPIDDRIKDDYAHTAILARALTSPSIKPIYATLHAASDERYAGQTLAFRQAHPRHFLYYGQPGIEALLVDDIITTGSTLLEARDTLRAHGVQVAFALTLADADR
ncbi:MAG: ComF family protein [Campylobacterales bacterium]